MKRSLRLIVGCALLLVAASAPAAPRDESEPTSTVIANQDGGGQIEVLAQGEGPVIVLLPSLGRSASDFDAIAVRLASAGYRVLRPQPRGVGLSVAPLSGIDLHDYAADVATVIEQEKKGPAFVVGHAFGNRIARVLAADRPELVTAVAFIAESGRSLDTPRMRAAIRDGADPDLPEAKRLKALQRAFFAPGNDASAWLHGWYPDALAAERRAGELTSRQEDAREVPILHVQPSNDPLSRVDAARADRQSPCDSATVVVIERAGHAVVVEQPDAVSAALIGYARRLWPHAMLQ